MQGWGVKPPERVLGCEECKPHSMVEGRVNYVLPSG